MSVNLVLNNNIIIKVKTKLNILVAIAFLDISFTLSEEREFCNLLNTLYLILRATLEANI